MRYDDQIIDQIQSASDIVDVIGQFVSLKKGGRNFKGLCPFHEEKTPSFMVSPEKQIYHCFGCGAGGSVFAFLMQYENLSFPEALRNLAERAGIRLPEKTKHGGEGGRSENEKIYDLYRAAAEYYHKLFLDPAAGKQARDYFLGRGFSLETAKEFQIGWAPEAWQGLFEHLSKKGFPEALMLKARLINRSDSGRAYDLFRGRLMFPIHNLQGKAVAFGGRLIAKAEGPKYLNSPEHPAFIKRRELFGLYLAKKHLDRSLPRMMVVEGYLDFLRLYESGFKTAVATLGTSLSEDHVAVLKRFVEEAVVIYDGDQAGEAASLRGLEVFLEGGLNVRLVQLPAGEDPDDFLKSRGPAAFKKLLTEAKEFFDYKLEILLRHFDPRDSLGLMKITNECLDTLLKIKSPILLDRYLKKLSGALGIDESSLRLELQKLREKQGSAARTQARPAAVSAPAAPRPAGFREEALLLGLLVDDKAFQDKVFGELEENDFAGRFSQSLFRRLKAMAEQGMSWNWPQILNRLEDENFKKELVSVTSFDWGPEDRQKALEDCLKQVKKRRIERRLEEIRREIAKAERLGDQGLVLTYTKQYQSLLQQIR